MTQAVIDRAFWISAAGALCMSAAATLEGDVTAFTIAVAFTLCAIVFREVEADA